MNRLTGIAIRKFFLMLGILFAGMQFAMSADKEAEGVSLNFVNADIDSVVRAVSKITKRNFLVDPRVKGTLNIVTNKPVSPEVAYQMLLSALRLQGFVAVQENGIMKVIPEAEAKLHAVPVTSSRSKPRGDQLVTRVFTIRFESATQLAQVIRPLVSPNNTVTTYANNNTIIVTDYAENIDRIDQIIKAIDVTPGDVKSIPVEHTSAVDLAVIINKLLAENGSTTEPNQRVTVIADARLNNILIRSDNPSRIETVTKLVRDLDREGKTGNYHVIYLKNADAEKVAKTLRAVLTGEPVGGTTTTAASGTPISGQSAATASSSITQSGGDLVQADRATNSLIIKASDVVFNNIVTVVNKLDNRRTQVFIEALIAEVSADRAAEFGIQWQSANTGGGNSATVFGGTNFGNAGSNILNLAKGVTPADAGLNLVVGKGTITLPGTTTPILNLTVLARFLETQTNSNILSTPSLVAVDNEEAKIVVGQNLPFVTGQYTNTGAGTGVANPFQTIERHDVGLTLKIRPQISQGGSILLQIYEESSSVVDTTVTSANGPTTNKRSIETVALVDDGAIIALGGLVQDSFTGGVSKVPLLGDIPLIGSLFRYDTRKRSKTNLYVFLRPKILRDTASYQGASSDRYNEIIGQQKAVNHPRGPVFKETEGPELPPLLPPSTQIPITELPLQDSTPTDLAK